MTQKEYTCIQQELAHLVDPAILRDKRIKDGCKDGYEKAVAECRRILDFETRNSTKDMDLWEYESLQQRFSRLLNRDTLMSKGIYLTVRLMDGYKQAVLACKSVLANHKPER